MSEISKAFSRGKAFIPFIICGDPDLETTAEIIRAAAENGADIIELGIPFSDPTAEGPEGQAANLRALSSGTTAEKIFGLVKELRKDIKTPFVFMTYANVVFSYGAEKFISTCGEIGVNGIIFPDVPFEEKDEFAPICKKHKVELISMIAPAPQNRIAKIAREAEGFVYAVSDLGVTEMSTQIYADIASMVKVIRANTDIPCAAGLGIPTPEQAKKMAEISDGAIVGSAIVKLVAEHGKLAPRYVGDYVKLMKSAIEKC